MEMGRDGTALPIAWVTTKCDICGLRPAIPFTLVTIFAAMEL
jgi:hypothetical protein